MRREWREPRATPGRVPAADRDLRASDADRERAAETLRVSAGEGRLEPDELDERLEAVYTAATLRDLDDLTADLPRGARAPSRERRVGPSFAPLLLGLVIALAIVVHPLIWLALIPLFSLGGGCSTARRRHRPVGASPTTL